MRLDTTHPENRCISVIIPAFNEQDSVALLTNEILEVADTVPFAFEIIFIDDGSTDSTADRIEALCATHSHIKLIKFRRNFGKAAALDAGFAAARGDIIFTMDADLQDDPREIPKFLDALQCGYDIVSGWKHVRHDPIDKTLPSKLFNRTVSWLSGVGLHDFNCGFKAYRAETLQDLNLYGELHRFIPVLLHWQGFKVGEIVVNHRARRHGVSKYGMGRLFKGALDFLGVMLNTRYATRPLHVFGGFGFAFGGLGLLILAYLSGLWVFGTGPIGDRPLLLLGILMVMSAFQFVTIGLLGEFIQSERADRARQYKISSTSNFRSDMRPEKQQYDALITALGYLKGAHTPWSQAPLEPTPQSGTSVSTKTGTRSTA